MLETIGQYGIAAATLLFAWQMFKTFTRELRALQASCLKMANEVKRLCAKMEARDRKVFELLESNNRRGKK